MMNKFLIAVTLLLLTACDSLAAQTATPTPSPRLASVNAQSTAVYAAALSADQSDAASASARATETAQRLNASAATQATLDAGYIAEQNARAAAAQAEAWRAQNSANVQATLEALAIISTTHAVTTTTMIQDVQTKQQIDASNDNLKNIIGYLPTCAISIVPFAIIYCLIVLARAGAARIAGDGDRAMHALAVMPPISIFQLPPPRYDDEEIEGNTGDHGITGNTVGVLPPDGNTGNTLVKTPHFSGTMDEYMAFQAEREAAKELLNLALVSLARDGKPDEGVIPRYDDLGMKPDRRQKATDTLEKKYHLIYVKRGGKKEEQGTRVLPPYSTVAELLDAITCYRAMYQNGTYERALSSAIGALPQREAQTT